MSFGEKVFSKLATFLFKTSRHPHGNYCIRLPGVYLPKKWQLSKGMPNPNYTHSADVKFIAKCCFTCQPLVLYMPFYPIHCYSLVIYY